MSGFLAGPRAAGLADIHTHFLPPRMLRGLAYFDTAGPLVGVSWPIRYKWSDEERVAHLRSMGVRMFSALAYAHRPDMAADLNAWTLAFGRPRPVPAVGDVLSRTRGDAVRARRAGRGARIFKIHLQVGGFPVDDPQLERCGAARRGRVPVVVHAGTRRLGPSTPARSRSVNC